MQQLSFGWESAEFWCRQALALGFSHAVPLDPAVLTAREDIRRMCAADKCGSYGKNHTCPPACGTLEQCRDAMHRFSRGILVQTVGRTQKTIDTRAYRETEQQHLHRFAALADTMRLHHPDALCLGTGGCRICDICAYPQPCRHPQKALSSMEAYGLFVTEVCRSSGLAYHHGDRTVTYTACILF